jgi:hypothetical protein
VRSFVEYYGEQKGAGGRGKGEEENINKKQETKRGRAFKSRFWAV